MSERQFVAGRVTIGIPTYNRSAFLVRAINSALGQTYRDIEVVVSDNASTDDTADRVREVTDPRIVYLKQPTNLGMVGNFNACLYAATGELIILVSDDDLLELTAVEKMSAPFFDPARQSPEQSVGVSWCPCMLIDGAGKPLWKTDGGPAIESSVALLAGLYRGDRGLRYCAAMFRTSDAIAVGGMNEARYGILFDTGNLGLVALRHPLCACIPEVLASYTMHSNSSTSQSAVQQWQTWVTHQIEDQVAVLKARGDAKGERILLNAHKDVLTNITATILLQDVRQKKFLNVLREAIRSRRYIFRPLVVKRILRDGWKLVRVQGR